MLSSLRLGKANSAAQAAGRLPEIPELLSFNDSKNQKAVSLAHSTGSVPVKLSDCRYSFLSMGNGDRPPDSPSLQNVGKV